MRNCEQNSSRIDLYLDGELRGNKLAAFNRHLKKCPSCRSEVAERRRFFAQLRAARPLYVPSERFRAEMTALLATSTSSPSSASGQYETTAASTIARGTWWPLWLRSNPVPVLIACALVIAVLVTLWKVSLKDARANAFVDMAVEIHRRQLAGHLPLEIRTNSPKEISTWFADKVPFHFRLPASQETAGQPHKYELTGGTLVNFRGTQAAYVAYRMQTEVISLVVTSASTSVAWGGEETISKGLTFHTHRREDLQVVTWSVHKLTYALVSGVDVPARQSCAVCHASANDRDLIRDLKSLNKPRPGRNNIDAHVLFTLCDEKYH